MLRRHWGIVGQLSELPSDSDQNFHVTAVDGSEFVLRIANSRQDGSFLQALVGLLRALESDELGTQRAIPAVDDRVIIRDHGPDGGEHWTWLTEWVEGRTLADQARRDEATLSSLGAFVARLDQALDAYASSYDTTPFQRVLDWDLARGEAVVREALKARAGVELFGGERWPVFKRAYDDHLARVAPLLGLLPTSLVHNDPNDHNVLISSSSDSPSVVGILDFGDAVLSYRVADVVIACAYAVMGSPTPIDDIDTIVRAYSAVRPLSELEARMVLPLVRLRLLVSVTVSATMSSVEPDNPYLVVSQAPAWQLLRQLDPVDMERAADRLARTAGHGVAPHDRVESEVDTAAVLHARKRLIGPSLSLSYDEPLRIERGWMQYLFDTDGGTYLDCVNNVCHVGHSHPAVVSALVRQAEKLNTNSRYLHPLRGEYAAQLLERLPEHLDTCFFVSSGSEANELALRIARVATGRTDVVVQDVAYHGSTSAMVDLSPYKFSGPGGGGRPEYVHVSPLPDPYRGQRRGIDDPSAHFVRGVEEALERAAARGGAAAFFAEPIPSCGGQIVPPNGYLRSAFERARAFGALAVADEVQTGFGRVGSAFWAFELDGAEPDIVTMGKPIGNGHPIGAVAVRRELAERFANGMEYFSTFGGNPVSCAVGLAVLDTMERRGLQAHALEVGQGLLDQFEELRHDDNRLGDVRGRGLFLGLEFVVPGEGCAPDAGLAHSVVQHARGEGVLLSTDGPHHNVIKIKPPLPFDADNARRVVEVVRAGLRQ